MDNSCSDNNETQFDNFSEEIEERIYKFNGEEIIKKYCKGKFLGKGGFAKCYELKCLNNKKVYAAKIVCKTNLSKQSAKQKLKSEIKIHKSLFHANIVKFEHVFEDNTNVYILLELCQNKTLNELIKKRKLLTEIEVRYYMDQVLKAVKFMHKNKIIHRDLKLGNLFLSENMELKIGDFGLATMIQYEGERKHTICGTPNYIAPEILEGKTNGHSYEVDFWAMGVIVYTLLIGRPPFETDDVKETYKKIHANNYSFPGHIFISDDAKDFITRVLVTNPAERLNLDQMRLHPFMARVPLPKAIPAYTMNHPPNGQFFRKYQMDTDQIKSLNDLSFEKEQDKLGYMREFALKNVKEVNKCNVNIMRQDKFQYNSTDNKCDLIPLNMNSQGGKFNDISQSKENHALLKKKKEKIEVNKITYVDTCYDYSSKFGILYTMNSNIIGCAFNDKSNMYKLQGKEEFYFENRRQDSRVKCYTLKIINNPEIKSKCEILCNFEKYLNTLTNQSRNINININNKSTTGTKTKDVYVRKVIKSDLAIMFKLSNKFIELIFKDNSKIILDNYENKSVVFIDKNKKTYTYSIHLVNKCNNKKFLNRYEHYKKVFFEKMEERFAKIQQIREGNSTEEKNLDNKSEGGDLNKTT